MPIHGGSINVSTTPIQVDGNSNGWSHIHIRNNDQTKTLFIGNSTVTAGQGLMINALETIDFDIPPGDYFCMVTSAGTAAVSYLRIDH